MALVSSGASCPHYPTKTKTPRHVPGHSSCEVTRGMRPERGCKTLRSHSILILLLSATGAADLSPIAGASRPPPTRAYLLPASPWHPRRVEHAATPPYPTNTHFSFHNHTIPFSNNIPLSNPISYFIHHPLPPITSTTTLTTLPPNTFPNNLPSFLTTLPHIQHPSSNHPTTFPLSHHIPLPLSPQQPTTPSTGDALLCATPVKVELVHSWNVLMERMHESYLAQAWLQ